MGRKLSPVPGKSKLSISISSLGVAGTAALPIWWLGATGVNGNSEHRVTYLEQGWDSQLREAVYYTPQSSRLMPYKWFLALEQVDDTPRFSAPENPAEYGYALPADGPSTLNPDGLPGNGNGGHAYPKGGALTHGDRMAVIEFLKDPTPLPPEKETE